MQQQLMIAGVDEAGRGPLAGPVMAAAVVLDVNLPIAELKDSKALSAAKREKLFPIIKSKAYAWAIAEASVAEIDELNILQASMLAMKRAVLALNLQLTEVLIDGNKAPSLPYPTTTVVKGDQKIAAISAASILAKVARDNFMLDLHQQYPDYGFNSHKGYPTKQHMLMLKSLGATVHHRKSFAPVEEVL